jgi:hypothetical protein
VSGWQIFILGGDESHHHERLDWNRFYREYNRKLLVADQKEITATIEYVQIWKMYDIVLKIGGGRSSTVRASGCGPEGCGFDSHRSPQ